MSYADTLLANGERVTLRSRQHWLAVFLESKWAWIALIGFIVLFWLNVGPLGKGDNGGLVDFLKNGLGLAALVLFVIAVVVIGANIVNYLNEEYLVTNRRVMKVSGFINKHAADSSLEKINDAVLDQNLFGRIFGYGDLDILTASDETVDKYKMLRGVVDFKKEMLNQKHDLEFEQMRPPVSPPLRAPYPPSGAQPAAPMTMSGDVAPGIVPPPTAVPPAAPVAPPTPTMTPAEVTQTLAGLADLRDRGAITPEEYEAKKSELLGRL
jgi:hypothetical protein